MTFHNSAFAIALPLLALAGCASSEHTPLIFGQATTLGVSVGANATTQSPEIAVGFKDANYAYVPTLAVAPDGSNALVQGTTSQDKDAYSTFGQFSSNSSTSGVGLGKFFATGIAARRLADGFACKVSDGTGAGCK